MLRRRRRQQHAPPPADRRARRAATQKRWRANDQAGRKIARVPIDAAVLAWLEREYPGKCDFNDLDDVGRLIGAVLASSARE
jgi:hypothetical protein